MRQGVAWPLHGITVLAQATLLETMKTWSLFLLPAGVKLKAWFSDEVGEIDDVGGLQEVACLPFDRHDMPMHFLRRWNVRSVASACCASGTRICLILMAVAFYIIHAEADGWWSLFL